MQPCTCCVEHTRCCTSYFVWRCSDVAAAAAAAAASATAATARTLLTLCDAMRCDAMQSWEVLPTLRPIAAQTIKSSCKSSASPPSEEERTAAIKWSFTDGVLLRQSRLPNQKLC